MCACVDLKPNPAVKHFSSCVSYRGQVTIASFTTSGVEMVGRGCARDCGTAAVQTSLFECVCDFAR